MCKPLVEEEPSPPQSFSSAAVLDYCWSCLDGRHRGDSCLQLHRSGLFLLHTMTAQYRFDLAQALAAAVEGVRFSQLLEVNVVVQVQKEVVEVPHWRSG